MKKYDQHKIKRGVIRKDQLDAESLDGRRNLIVKTTFKWFFYKKIKIFTLQK